MRSGGNRFRLAAAVCVVLAATLTACSSSAAPAPTTGTATLDAATTATFGAAGPFSPATAAVNGSTDVYHCFLVDPHLTTNRELVSSEFLPEARKEVHHAIYFLIPPQQVPEARSLNAGSDGHGWSCFGAPLNPNGTFDNTTWLGGWAPGPIVAHPTPAGHRHLHAGRQPHRHADPLQPAGRDGPRPEPGADHHGAGRRLPPPGAPGHQVRGPARSPVSGRGDRTAVRPAGIDQRPGGPDRRPGAPAARRHRVGLQLRTTTRPIRRWTGTW